MPIQSINPATGELLRSFRPLEPEAIAAKIALAHDASHSYPSETLPQRTFWMRRLAHLLEAEENELATLMVTEMGKTIISARAEVAKCARACRYYAEQSEAMLAPEFIATEHARSYVRWDPLGVVLAVMPWNFPLWQVFRFLAPALMAGNVGLLKHASNVPQCALAIEALVRRAGFPRGVFQTLLIESKQVEKVLGDERVAAVTLTGSEAAGRAVAAQAGYLIKKSVLELGGSDPFIVMPSADLTQAVKNAVEARCINNGQSCIAAKRFIVHESVYREFEERFVGGMAAQIVGDPMNEATQIGPLATSQVAEDLQKQVDAAIHAGGRLLTGGRRLIREGNFFSPTVDLRAAAHSRGDARGDLRAAGARLQGQLTRRGDFVGERHTVWPGRELLDQRGRGAAAAGAGAAVRFGVFQHAGRERSATAVRRHQAQRLWARTFGRRHARVPECKDGRRCGDGSAAANSRGGGSAQDSSADARAAAGDRQG